jgi:SAM-dependent methyltransferase
MFYGRDVAHGHDTGHGDFARGAGAWLAGALSPPGRVVELGCGSGITSRLLVDAGFEVTGVDLSPDLLAIARDRVPEASFERASFLDFELPSGCRAVTAFSEVLNYLADERVGRSALAQLFRRVHDALEPGGLFVFDVLETGGEIGDEPGRSWVEGDGWVMCVERTEAGRLLTRTIVMFREQPGGGNWRRSDEEHRVLLLPRAEVTADLLAAGFELELLSGYGDMAFRGGLVGFAARRP